MITNTKRFLSQERTSPSALEVAEMLPKIPVLVRHPVRCGRSNCRCAQGELHEAWRLVWRDPGGFQQFSYVRKAEVAAVKAVVDLRRQRRMMERADLRAAYEQIQELERWLRDLERENS